MLSLQTQEDVMAANINHEIAKIPERVQQGMAYLDDMKPNWRSIVKLPVKMSRTSKCILGQIDGDYHRSSLRSADRQTNADRGFCEPMSVWLADRNAYYRALSEEWSRQLGYS